MLITIVVNSLILSLCNIYAQNNLGEHLEFLQELNDFLINKAELTTLSAKSKIQNRLFLGRQTLNTICLKKVKSPPL